MREGCNFGADFGTVAPLEPPRFREITMKVQRARWDYAKSASSDVRRILGEFRKAVREIGSRSGIEHSRAKYLIPFCPAWFSADQSRATERSPLPIGDVREKVDKLLQCVAAPSKTGPSQQGQLAACPLDSMNLDKL